MIKKDSVSEMKDNLIILDNQLGSVLQKARLAKNLRIEDVANAIHLGEKQIQALENNQFSVLPEPTITRGFIRNYANFLEIDYEPLLQRYRSLVPNQASASIVVNANVNEVMSQHAQQPWLLYVLGSILVLLFLTAWFYYMDSVEAPLSDDKIAQVKIVDEKTQNNDVTQNATPTSSTLQQQVDAASSSVPFVSSDNLASQPPSSNALPDNATPQSVTQAQPTAPVPVIPALTTPPVAKKLELILRDASWVRVKDKTGQVILEKTIPAGGVESLDGEVPFNIIIGNAVGAKVKFYGQEVDLTAATSKNIIRLKLE